MLRRFSRIAVTALLLGTLLGVGMAQAVAINEARKSGMLRRENVKQSLSFGVNGFDTTEDGECMQFNSFLAPAACVGDGSFGTNAIILAHGISRLQSVSCMVFNASTGFDPGDTVTLSAVTRTTDADTEQVDVVMSFTDANDGDGEVTFFTAGLDLDGDSTTTAGLKGISFRLDETVGTVTGLNLVCNAYLE